MHKPLHPVHVVLLAGTVPLFLGELLNDIAYANTSEIQWKNFASWLIVGGLFFAGFAFAWSLVDFFLTSSQRGPMKALYPALMLTIFVVGLINAFVHSADAWASVPTGPVLSAIGAVLTLIAAGIRLHPHARVSA